MPKPESSSQITNEIPQVLLFGHSGSGKSALLAALLRAGETEGGIIQGEIVDLNGRRVVPLGDALYRGDQSGITQRELTSYLITVLPKPDNLSNDRASLTVLVNDCSGQVAESLLEQPDTLPDASKRIPVAQAVIEADAILLLLDATSTDEELQAAFEEFDAFLTVIAQTRAKAREVGGSPILLVLTKCDELAQAGDTRTMWLERVNQRAEQAWRQLDAFLKDADSEDATPSPFLPFGSIDLSVYTVAIRWPKLLDSPARPDTPFQVAELFRDCFHAAVAHRIRATTSNQRLKWTVRIASALVMFLSMGMVSVLFFAPQATDPDLAQKVDFYRKYEPEVAVRLSEPWISENKRRLKTYLDDPGFASLPSDLHSYVLSRWAEINTYENFYHRLLKLSAPADVRNLEDLNRIEETLKVEFVLPSPAWIDTWVGQLRSKWLDDIAAIRAGEVRFLERYQSLERRARELTLTPNFSGNWRADVNLLFSDGMDPPAVELTAPLPGSRGLKVPHGRPVTARVPFEFDRVYRARKEWEAAKEQLIHMKDLADALGLTTGPDRPEPALDIPEPRSGINSATLPGERWTYLLRNYNRTSPDFEEWQVHRFRDPSRSVLDARLERSFANGVRHVQGLLEQKLDRTSNQYDTPVQWKQLAESIGDPASPFPEWGRLLHLIARLRNPEAGNPVAELFTFLQKPKFELNLQGFDLRNPSLEGLIPIGALTVTQARGDMVVAVKRFKHSGDNSPTRLSFIPEGDGKLTYIPGDDLRVELPIRLGNQEFKLIWEEGQTLSYQFDRLDSEPRLLRIDGRSEPATNVRLSPKPSSSVPRLPTLFPPRHH